jgi:putative membrane protein
MRPGRSLTRLARAPQSRDARELMSSKPQTQRRMFPIALFAAYVIVFILLGIAPYDRGTWWAENIPIVVLAGALAVLYVRGVRLSNLAYLLASVLLFMHTVGGHYTFERVPFGWVTRAFGFERNHYDRVAHFAVGFYAFALAELLITRKLVNRSWIAYLFGIFCIGTVAALYEIIEWIYAALAGGSAGAAFLGSQGDIWDAQKDMLADISGALFAIVILWLRDRLRPRHVAEY